MPTETHYTVVPLIRLPPYTLQSFTYKSFFLLTEGDLVSIRFRKKRILGVVLATNPFSPSQNPSKNQALRFHFKVQSVLKIIQKKFFTALQIQLAQAVAEFYLESFAFLLKRFSPAIALKDKAILQKNQLKKDFGISKIKINREQIKNAQKLIQHLKKTKEILFLSPLRLDIYLYLIAGIFNQKKQVLFLVPDLFLARHYAYYFQNIWGKDKIVLFSKQQKKSSILKQWRKIQTNFPLIIIGTRSALFLPFNQLGLIIIEEAHNPSFKQWDQGPRYEAKTIAKILIKISNTALIYGTNCPPIDLFYKLKKEKKVFLPDCFKKQNTITPLSAIKKTKRNKNRQDLPFNRSDFESKANLIKITQGIYRGTILDTGEKKFFHQSKIFSDPLLKIIQKTLQKPKKIFLISSQKGEANCLFCQDCHFIPQCINCKKNYLLLNTQTFQCPICKKQVPVFLSCPQCQSPLIKPLGFGEKMVYKEIHTFFPKHKILLIKKDSLIFKTIHLYTPPNHQGLILIGNNTTASILKFLQPIDLTVFLNPDRSFFIGDFDSHEQRYQEITQNYLPPSRLFIQTKYPEDQIFKDSILNNFLAFSKKELEKKRTQNLPPFGNLIKFIAQDEIAQKAKKKLQQLKNKMVDKVENYFIIGPYPGYPEKIRQKFVFYLTISLKTQKEKEKIKANLKFILKEKIKIDINPKGML